MDKTLLIVLVVIAFVIIGGLIGLIAASRKKTQRLKGEFGTEYKATMKTMGSRKKGQKELDERQKHVKTLTIRPLSANENDRYKQEWNTLQARFVDEPGQAIESADHLIMEVMSLRGYPVSDFDQRAADISVQYPKFVSDYRAARAIAGRDRPLPRRTPNPPLP